MRLHLGCGARYVADAVNVDRFDLTVADVAADARRLPFRSGAFDEVVALQLVEHLGYAGALYALSEWLRVLRPSGRLELETPEPEASFRRFLDAETDEARDRALGWIFGDEAPGYGHALLFPEELLRRMLEDAGFDWIERGDPTSYVSEPGLRLVARAADRQGARALAALRARMAPTVLSLGDPSEAAELEAGLLRHLRAAVADDDDARGRHVEAALVIWPRATAWWLAEVEALGLDGDTELRPWAATAEAMTRFELGGRLGALVESRAAPDPAASHPYDELTWKGRRVVRLHRRGGGTPASCWREVLGAPPPEPEGELFTASRVVRLAGRLLARALKHWTAGDRAAAREGLLRARRTGSGQLYALWNLGRLEAVEGSLESAVAALEDALVFATDVEAGPLLADLGACLLARGSRRQAVALLADPRVGEVARRRVEAGGPLAFAPLGAGEVPRG